MQSDLSKRSRFLWLAVCCAALALLMLLVVAFEIRQRMQVQQQMEARSDSMMSLAFQFDREYLRLLHSLRVALLSRQHVDPQEIDLRVAVLSSRLDILLNSPVMGAIVNETRVQTLLQRIGQIIANLETATELDGKNRTILESQLLQMEDLQPAVQRLSFETNSIVVRILEKQDRAVLQQNAMTIAFSAAQVVLLMLMAFVFNQRRVHLQRERATLRETNQRLARSEQRLKLAASVFNQGHESIVIVDRRGCILEVNDSFCKATQFGAYELVGIPVTELFPGLDVRSKYFDSAMQTLSDKGYWEDELSSCRSDGSEYPVRVSVSQVVDAKNLVQNYVVFIDDISAMKQRQLDLEHVAHFDTLTGLPNRVLLVDRLQKAMSVCQRSNRFVAIAFLDLDGFKEVNDRHGHAAGDQLLVELARRMNSALRSSDSIARYGGDEFVFLIAELGQPKDCIPVIERLLAECSSPVVMDAQSIQVSASIGITVYPDDNLSAENLIRHADQAMYLAKQSGKNQFCFFDTVKEGTFKAQMASIPEVKLALERDEFVLHYQPQVNMRTGEVVGVEALIRWSHPEKGFLLPGQFLPIIADHPISVQVGKWVVAAATRQIQAWAADGFYMPVSINVDAIQLQHPDFLHDLQQVAPLCTFGSMCCLSIEILETTALSDVEQVRTILNACRSLGIEVALDDFGTGYSSLTYLRQLPVQQLKIDQSFVLKMHNNQDDLSIVDAVVGLAHAFNRDVIAEGVETLEHGEVLLRMGCQIAQGYCIARPMCAEDLRSWVQSWISPPSWKKQVYTPRDTPALLGLLSRTAPLGIAIVDKAGQVKHVNAQCCAILGYESQALLLHPISQCFPVENRAAFEALHSAFMEEECETESHWTVVRQDGTTGHVKISSVRVPGEHDTPYRMVYLYGPSDSTVL